MGLSEDVVSREGIIASMADVALKQFLFLRNLAEPVVARFGERGMKALDAASGITASGAARISA
jgi:hypothetical protein